MVKRWIVVMRFPENEWAWNEVHSWWCNREDATRYSTQREADATAFRLIAMEIGALYGHVSVTEEWK